MCGIAGFVDWKKTQIDSSIAERMLVSLAHRGPDDNGIYSLDQGFLLHTRLAIIDPKGGAQPLRSRCERYVLSYNGELYNYKELKNRLIARGHSFRTESDSEVILSAFIEWGSKCLLEFNGMFAFAVYDCKLKNIFIARDRLGIKPVVYYADQKSFIFASELQTLLCHPRVPREIDYESLDDYLHYQYVPHPYSIYKNVFKLSPGHYLEVSDLNRQPTISKYWDIDFRPDDRKSENEWLEALDELMDKVVGDHLVSDVPFGGFLSGGVDSGLVLSQMKEKLTLNPKAFTIGFEDRAFSEIEEASGLADKIGCDHRIKYLKPPSFDHIATIMTSCGEPFADSSIVPTFFVSKFARECGVKMVLSGDGGDELFGGYNTYESILRQSQLSFVEQLTGKKKTDAHFLNVHSRVYAYFNDDVRASVYTPELKQSLVGSQRRDDFRLLHFNSTQSWPDILARLQYLDIKTYLANDILYKVDIASMNNSLEVRVPFLDHRLVEFAFTIPSKYKIRRQSEKAWQKKYLLKKYAEKKLGKEFLSQPKKGFGIPLSHWLNHCWLNEVNETLLSKQARITKFIDLKKVDSMVNGGSMELHGAQIWALLSLELNLKKNEATPAEVVYA